jgi:hypothetical protein
VLTVESSLDWERERERERESKERERRDDDGLAHTRLDCPMREARMMGEQDSAPMTYEQSATEGSLLIEFLRSLKFSQS